MVDQRGEERRQGGALEALGEVLAGNHQREHGQVAIGAHQPDVQQVAGRTQHHARQQRPADAPARDREARQEHAGDADPDAVDLADRRDLGLGVALVDVERRHDPAAQRLVGDLGDQDEGQQPDRQRRAEAAEEIGEGLDHPLADARAPGLGAHARDLRLAGEEHRGHRDQQEGRHRAVHHRPRQVVRHRQRQGAGDDERDAVAERIRRQQRALRFPRRDLDAIGIHADVEGCAGEGRHQRDPHERREVRGRDLRHHQQRAHDQQQRQQDPAAPQPEAPQHRECPAVHQRRPHEFQRVGQARARDQGDRLEVDVVVLEPVREGAGHQQERQAGGEAEEEHRPCRGLGEGLPDPGLLAIAHSAYSTRTGAWSENLGSGKIPARITRDPMPGVANW